jgi:hypothetical protein
MKNKIIIVLSLFFVVGLSACSNTEVDDDPKDEVTVNASDTLIYSLDRLSQVDLNVSLDALVATEPENVTFVNKKIGRAHV